MYYDRLNELIFKCNCYGVNRLTMEYNLTFLMGLRKEWRNISLMIKTQQSFDNYSIGDLYNVLKTNQSKINQIVEDEKLSLGGPLTPVSKVSRKQLKLNMLVLMILIMKVLS